MNIRHGSPWLFLLIFPLLISFNIGLAQEMEPYGNTSKPELHSIEKDPFIAGLLSWFMMGIGQIYCREYTKGSIFMAADLLDKGTFILLISHINKKYAPDNDESIYINWKAFDTGTKVMVIGYVMGSLTLRFYNVIDAVKSAQKYNERYLSESEERGLLFDMNEGSVSLGYTLRFGE